MLHLQLVQRLCSAHCSDMARQLCQARSCNSPPQIMHLPARNIAEANMLHISLFDDVFFVSPVVAAVMGEAPGILVYFLFLFFSSSSGWLASQAGRSCSMFKALLLTAYTGVGGSHLPCNIMVWPVWPPTKGQLQSCGL